MAPGRDAMLFLVLAFFWGTAFVAIGVGLDYLPPLLFASLRYDIAGVLMLLYAAGVSKAWRPRSRADWTTVAISAILLIALYNAFLFTGQQVVTSGVAAILIAMNPILATGFSRVLLTDERLSAVGVVGLLLGFIGVGLVAAPSPSNVTNTHLLASAFVFVAALCVASGSVLMQRTESDISTEATVAWACIFGAIVLHLLSFGLPTESLADATINARAIGALLYLSVFASAVGYFIYFRLLDRLGAIEINLVSYATPVFAAVFGWIVLREVLTLQTIIGFLVIFLGFVLMKRRAIASLVPCRD